MSFIGCPLLLQNMHTNYLFGIYLTLFKQSQTNMSMCILTHEIISNVIELNKIHIELYTMMFIPSVDYDFTILFDMCDTAPHNIHNDLYIIGTIHWRGTRQLVFRVNRSFFELTQWTHRDVDYHLKMYCSYFYFLHGHGAYDEILTLFEYLIYYMKTLCSPFTLYKPFFIIYVWCGPVLVVPKGNFENLIKNIKQVKQ